MPKSSDDPAFLTERHGCGTGHMEVRLHIYWKNFACTWTHAVQTCAVHEPMCVRAQGTPLQSFKVSSHNFNMKKYNLLWLGDSVVWNVVPFTKKVVGPVPSQRHIPRLWV